MKKKLQVLDLGLAFAQEAHVLPFGHKLIHAGFAHTLQPTPMNSYTYQGTVKRIDGMPFNVEEIVELAKTAGLHYAAYGAEQNFMALEARF